MISCKIYLHYDRDVAEEGRATLQIYLVKLSGTAKSWNLSLNISKCIMRLSHKFVDWKDFGNGFEYKIGNSTLEVVKCHKDLAILVYSELQFHVHVLELVHKAARLSSNLLRSTVNRSPEFMVAIFNFIIQLILDYGSCV